jgi:hypothetical protein
MDDDCRADPEWLRELEAAFSSGASRTIVGGGVENSAPDNVFAEVGELILDVILKNYRPKPGGIYFFRAANLAVSSSDFRELGGFDTRFRTAEDRDLCDRWIHSGGSLSHVPRARVAHLNRLSFRGFCRQHFTYGKGAFHFHRARKVRRSGRYRAEIIPPPRIWSRSGGWSLFETETVDWSGSTVLRSTLSFSPKIIDLAASSIATRATEATRRKTAGLSIENGMMCTEAACSPQSHDDNFKEAFRSADAFKVDAEQLRIGFDRRGVMTFTYLGEPTLQGCYGFEGGTVCID